jgi:hypothetical protein
MGGGGSKKTTSDDRFPDALENSYRELPRSGILLMSFEAGRRHVAECGMQALFVIDLFQELADGHASLGQVSVFVAQHLFVLERFHERLAGRVGQGSQLHLMATLPTVVLKSSIHIIR